jgi:cytochrome c
MKKTFSILTLAAFCTLMAACGGGTKSDKVSADTAAATDQAAVAHNSEAVNDTTGSTGAERTGGGVASSSKGAELISKNDCLSCHKEHDKLVGPAYADVAKKYTSADIDKLADKVIKGGSGSWGDVPMSAHPSLSVDDAKEMVKYVLTVK